MSWFAKMLNKETDLISTHRDLMGWMKAIGFVVTEMESTHSDGVTFDRFRAKRKDFELMVVWDGNVISLLQLHQLRTPLDFESYQAFHAKKRYFTLTYDGRSNTLLVKHSAFMSRETPTVAATFSRVIDAWAALDLSKNGF